MAARRWCRALLPIAVAVIALPAIADEPGSVPTNSLVTNSVGASSLEGSVSVAVAHDSRVRHRTRVPTISGIEIIEICGDVVGGSDDWGDFDESEACYEVEVTTDPQARRILLNIADSQAATTTKLDHRLSLNTAGDTWRTVVEFAESWQVVATERNRRAIKVRSGPSWVIPAWKAQIDAGAIYQTNRQGHQTTLEFYAPFAAIELRPRPNLKLTALYRYEDRHPYLAELEGHAHFAEAVLRWDATPTDRLTLRGIFRRQSTADLFNSVVSPELRLSYRYGFRWFGYDGGFIEGETRLRINDFAAAGPRDGGVLRHDFVRSAILYLGHDFDRAWTIKSSYSDTSVTSTVRRFARQNGRVMLSLTRNF